MLVMRAWACGLRTIAMCSMPGSEMLSVQRVRPVISRWSSLRRRSLPISGLDGGALVDGGHALAPSVAAPCWSWAAYRTDLTMLW